MKRSHGACPDTSDRGDMAWLDGGAFTMGPDHRSPEKAPSRRVEVDGSGSIAIR